MVSFILKGHFQSVLNSASVAGDQSLSWNFERTYQGKQQGSQAGVDDVNILLKESDTKSAEAFSNTNDFQLIYDYFSHK